MRVAQRELTRSRLTEAAGEIFVERGYGRTTVDDIADRAGATRATFYLHFKSKAEVLLELMDRNSHHFDAIYAELGDVARDPSFDQVRVWLARAIREWDAIADVARAGREAAAIEPEVFTLMEKRDAAANDTLALALRQAIPGLTPRDAEIYGAVLLAPLRHYFLMHLRGERFNKPRVLDVMAASWMAVMAQAVSSVGKSRAKK